MFRCSNRAIHKMIFVTLMAFLCTVGTNSVLAVPPKAKVKAKAKTVKSKSSKAKAIKRSVKAHPKAHLAAKAALNKRFRYSKYNYRHLPVIAPRVARVVGVPVVKRVATVNVASGPVVDQPKQAVENDNRPILGRVVRVVDGQTLLVSSGGNKRKVRLLGIDLVRSEGSEINFEQKSKHHLAKLVLGKQVSLTHDESVAKEDEEGVAVAYVHRKGDNTFLNLKMIRDGYSLAASTYEYQLSDIFAGQQEQAQEKGAGIWAHIDEPSES